MKDVDPSRIARAKKGASSKKLREYSERLMSNKNTWCVASIPTPAWAKKVFPDIPVDQAVDKLWDAILKAVRADLPDPVEAWEQHKAALKRTLIS
jgi:aminopeptidase